MEGKGSISDYRSKMDKTLSSPDLTNHEKLQTLVRNQILQSSNSQFEGCLEDVVERRSKELANFLGMLRSTALVNGVERSRSSEDGWKVKQDTEEFRVMYREGPEGTPLHTLLVEGYVDGPLDVCLCISWESSLYNKWWPQTAIPTFKIVSSRVLQRVGAGEQISLVRMKVSWPLSSREALLHYFAFEYFQDDLMVVLLNSISDSETIERRVHGFTRDGIPDAEEVVRIDVVGGFALQKVNANRSYFRTIANMDIKLDFVPPSFINFISRQLIGSGFKLYKKEVASVTKGDQKFCHALKDKLYARIRKGLDSARPQKYEQPYEDDCVETISATEGEDVEFGERNEVKNSKELKENDTEALDDCTLTPSNGSNDQHTCKSRPNKEALTSCSDKEEGLESSRSEEKKVPISPKVEKALETLESLISIFQEQRSINGLNSTHTEKEAQEQNASREQTSNSYKRETNHSKISPAEVDEGQPSPSSCRSSISQPSMEQKSLNQRKNKKYRFCCMHFLSQY